MRISVIFASPSTFNAGMQMVDNAWDLFVERNNLNVEVVKYRFDSISFDGGEDSEYKCLTKHYREMLSSDRIIYWGDFLHMNHYQVRKAKQLFAADLYDNYEQSLEFVQKVLLLKGLGIEIQSKAITFGTNQMLEGTAEKLRAPYFTDVNVLVKNARAWLPRDLYTANMANIIRNAVDYTQGVDCAILAWPNLFQDGLNVNQISVSNAQNIGCFFGRSSSRYLKLSSFAHNLAKKSNSKLVWIPWINREGRINKFKEKLYKFWVDDTESGYDLDFTDIEWIKSFKFIITDTYHLAVNSWASGTPAICIGDTISLGRSSGGNFSWNDKRFMFYQMSDALDFFVHARELDSRKSKKKRTDHLLNCLENKELLNWILQKISKQAKISQRYLVKAIKEEK